jgi:hypothetical protein
MRNEIIISEEADGPGINQKANGNRIELVTGSAGVWATHLCPCTLEPLLDESSRGKILVIIGTYR